LPRWPQILVNAGAVAIKAAPVGGQLQAEPRQLPRHRANGYYRRGGV
jgi:hypothetical protein